ncbi:MAG: crossover junction endodeoxyribonuclease RuvC [Pseudomonadota bacterium]
MALLRILGLDPGLRRTGWGVIGQDGNKLSYIACGVIKPDEKLDLAERLRLLHDGLASVIQGHAPQEAAVEETFMNTNAASALKLGQARGIAMLTPALHGLAVAEYSANVVKKTVTGAGHADKKQIGHMIGVLLPKAQVDSEDAADALAIAICHAHHRQSAMHAKRVLK